MGELKENGAKPILELKDIGKKYGAVEVLRNIDFKLYPGEVHALMGENGAGKSTLSKIISGVIKKSQGAMYVNGESYEPENTDDAKAHGISIVHQEFNLIPVLSVAANIFLGKEYRKGGILDERKHQAQAKELLEQLGLDIPVGIKVRDLSIAQQQMVEIAKCLSDGSQIIIMDEPSATLTLNETKQLFKIIESLKNKGVAFIYISHKMDEIFQISQKITVLRDGNEIGTFPTEDMTEDKLVSLMVGRQISSMYNHENYTQAETVLKVSNLKAGKTVKDVSFSLKKGEVLGFGGLVGAGRSELMKMLFGELAFETGEIELFGNKINRPVIKKMIEAGFIYLTENRKEEGLILTKTIRENITLSVMKEMLKGGLISNAKEVEIADRMVKELDIKLNNINQRMTELSGGNQQKVVIAKWLATNPRILVLDEPTRGIDVGAKHEIYQVINRLCKQGMSIIIISSEMPELIGMCDRVIIMAEGKITGELSGEEITEENIMAKAVLRGYSIA